MKRGIPLREAWILCAKWDTRANHGAGKPRSRPEDDDRDGGR